MNSALPEMMLNRVDESQRTKLLVLFDKFRAKN